MPVRRVCVRLSNVNDASSINSHLDKKQIHFQKANNQQTDRPSKKNRLIREGIQTGEPGEQSPVSIWLNTPTVLRSGSLWPFTSAVVIHTELHYEVRRWWRHWPVYRRQLFAVQTLCRLQLTPESPECSDLVVIKLESSPLFAFECTSLAWSCPALINERRKLRLEINVLQTYLLDGRIEGSNLKASLAISDLLSPQAADLLGGLAMKIVAVNRESFYQRTVSSPVCIDKAANLGSHNGLIVSLHCTALDSKLATLKFT